MFFPLFFFLSLSLCAFVRVFQNLSYCTRRLLGCLFNNNNNNINNNNNRPSESPDFDDIFDDFEEEDEVIFGSDEDGDGDVDEVDEQGDQEEEQDGVEYLADPEMNGCELTN